jgi:hypothetical protein
MSDKPTQTNLDSIELDDLHSRLAERLTEVVEAAREADVENEVEIEVEYDDSDLTSVHVRPLEDWTQEGEKGMDRYHLILGKGGAVKSARRSSVFTGDKEFTRHQYGGSANRMWKIAVIGGIERMA